MMRVFDGVDEEVGRVPNGGFGYGLLRYLNGRTSAQLAARPTPDVSFNYLGRVVRGARPADASWMRVDDARIGAGAAGEMPLGHAVDVNAAVVDGDAGVEIRAQWTWTQRLADAAIDRIADRWQRVLAELAREPVPFSARGVRRS
jgi:non-ribosomal peptide synthase protein (TIGR01720 family)